MGSAHFLLPGYTILALYKQLKAVDGFNENIFEYSILNIPHPPTYRALDRPSSLILSTLNSTSDL